MLLLLFIISTVIMVVGIVLMSISPKSRNGDWTNRDTYLATAIISGLIAGGLFIAMCFCIVDIATEFTIDKKIAMYEEENMAIEQDVDTIVKSYMEHEQKTFNGLKAEKSSIVLITMFPELKSDELVQQQLDIYIANNGRIRELKEEQIIIDKMRWIVYFGK